MGAPAQCSYAGAVRWWLTLGISAALSGCGPQVGEVDGKGGGSDSGDADTGAGVGSASSPMTTSPPTPPPPSTSTSTTGPDPTATDTGADGTDDGISFIAECDLAGAPPGTKAHCSGPIDPCDPWAQDCPRGEKCVPWANDGGVAWNSTVCVPVDPNPAGLGEACTAVGSAVSGFDDCDFGSMCLVDDHDTLTGACVAQCTGSELSPQCQAGSTCMIGNNGSVTLCLAYCDPLALDCPAGRCLPIGPSAELLCAPTYPEAPTLVPGDGCTYDYECIETAQCNQAGAVADCAGPDCCTSYCDLDAPDPLATCLPGQECIAWYAPGAAPAGFDHVGLCTAP